MNHLKDAWVAEFEGLGEEYIRDSLHAGLFNEEKRHFAYAWLHAQAKTRSRREKKMLRYVRLTLAVAVTALLVGIVGLLVR